MHVRLRLSLRETYGDLRPLCQYNQLQLLLMLSLQPQMAKASMIFRKQYGKLLRMRVKLIRRLLGDQMLKKGVEIK